MKLNSLLKSFSGLVLMVFLAILFRTIFFEPFHIPYSSMKPNLLIGDYIFVNKMAYGYSRYSLPFHFNFINGKIFARHAKRGDVAVFVPPKDSKRYYIKRVFGIGGDKILIENGDIYINDCKINDEEAGIFPDRIDELKIDINFNKFIETNCDGKKYDIMHMPDKPSLQEKQEYIVPDGHVFMMGDNRDNSKDSRFEDVSFIPEDNLVGRASFIAVSFDTKIDFGSPLNLINFIRYNRIFHPIN